MTQEDKELLLQDLSARLPHKMYVKTTKGIGYVYAINTSQLIELSVANDSEYWSEVFNIDEVKPYLRPMSSKTEEEIKELFEIDMKRMIFSSRHLTWHLDGEVIDYLNKKMLDWRGLIPKGLALEAPEEMYIIT